MISFFEVQMSRCKSDKQLSKMYLASFDSDSTFYDRISLASFNVLTNKINIITQIHFSAEKSRIISYFLTTHTSVICILLGGKFHVHFKHF